MDTYAVDFETYYDKEYSLKTLGVDAYCADKRFDPYMVAIHGPDVDYVGPVEDAPWDKLDAQHWVSHNARFDETVYQQIQTNNPFFNVSSGPAEWNCTADMSVYLSAPRSLAGASYALLGIQPDKTVRAKMLGKRRKDLTLTEQANLIAYAREDARLCYQLWTTHAAKWPEHERRISQINRECGKYGVQIAVDKLEGYLDTLKHVMWKAELDIPWDWDKTPLSPKKLRAECRKAGIKAPASLAADSKECIAWERKYGDEYPWVGAMRDWRRSNILRKRLETIQKRLRPDGVFPFSIKYFGGHTGRFSGDGGFNIQNMPRGEIMGVDLRSLFVPRPGKTLAIADLAQIEARITLWLARDFETLEQVEKGLSVYEAHAVATMGWDSANGKLKEKDPKLYQLAKARVLGLGFGCGWRRFKELAETMFGILMDDDEAQKTVNKFRQSNPRIVALWKELHRDCARSKGKTFIVELPSGRDMRYYNIKTYPDLNAEVVRTERRIKVYGGKLTEHIVQATAREVFVEGLLRLHDAGYRILFHVHDEYVLEVPKGTDLKPVQDIIEEQPAWLPRCPVGAEVFASDQYLK